MSIFDLDATVERLASAIEPLSLRSKGALFGACGAALMPVLDTVDEITRGRWTFLAARSALAPIAAFVTGAAEPGNHDVLRREILDSGPHGHELDAPWSTYAQDALICLDAALVVASDVPEEFKPVWVFSAVEPMLASLNARGYDADFEPVEVGSTELQREMDATVDFLSSAVVDLSIHAVVPAELYANLIVRARAVVPPFAEDLALRRP
jgi:hypothetical protein